MLRNRPPSGRRAKEVPQWMTDRRTAHQSLVRSSWAREKRHRRRRLNSAGRNTFFPALDWGVSCDWTEAPRPGESRNCAGATDIACARHEFSGTREKVIGSFYFCFGVNPQGLFCQAAGYCCNVVVFWRILFGILAKVICFDGVSKHFFLFCLFIGYVLGCFSIDTF